MPAGDLRETLEAILDHLRRLLDPSGCAFQTVDWESGEIRAEAAWFASEAVQQAMTPILQRPYEPDRPGLTEAAIEQGRPLVLADVTAWPGSGALQARLHERLDPEAAEIAWRWYRDSAFVACPVRNAAGSTLGALAISVPASRPLGQDELRAVDVVAGLAALALEGARRAQEELLLADASREMAGSLDPEAVHAAVIHHAARISGADRVMLSRFEEPLQQLRVVASTGLPAEVIESYADVEVTLGPRRFGVLTIGHRRDGAIDAEAVRRVEALARLAAGAIANAIAFQHERRIARALARGFLPAAAPAPAGIETGVVYSPMGPAGGGDFYGVWDLPDGGTALLVGDVSGKGLEVSAISAMARFFVEARCVDSTDPARVLGEVDDLLRRRSPDIQLVTAFLGLIQDGRLRWCNAGHLPPLMLSRGRAPVELAAGGIPLGIDDAPPRDQGETAFERGDLLVAVTDGLVEARRHGEQFGEARLREIATSVAGEPAQAVAARIHEHMTSWATNVTDDVIVLAVRCT